MKKFLSLILSCLMVASLCAMFVQASEPTLTLSKSSYTEGEDVCITAVGDGAKDWVGIYKKDELPGGPVARQWYYVQNGNGESVNLTTGGETSAPDHGAKLPAGDYIAYYLLNDGYEIAASVEFTIAPAAVVEEPETDQPEVVDPDPVAPQTADIVVLAEVIGLCSGAAVMVSKKRK